MDKMKKISIPLIDKLEIIHAVADGSMTYELIKKKYNLRSSSNISTILSKKEKYLGAYKKCSGDPSRKTLKSGKFTKIDEALINFISQSCNVGVAIDDEVLKV
jgi:hypothetical protein